jgi:hypothetical protein
MSIPKNHYSSQPVIVFHESRLPVPVPAAPAGYAALVDAHRLKIPWPRELTAISKQNKSATSKGWRVLPARC